MTFFYSILISRWRCFLRFDEVKAIHFPAQRGPFSLLPFVLTLWDNHIGDLSLTRLRVCLSRSNTAAGLAWTAKESTPFSTSTETRRGRERINPGQWFCWKQRESEGVLANTPADRQRCWVQQCLPCMHFCLIFRMIIASRAQGFQCILQQQIVNVTRTPAVLSPFKKGIWQEEDINFGWGKKNSCLFIEMRLCHPRPFLFYFIFGQFKQRYKEIQQMSQGSFQLNMCNHVSHRCKERLNEKW